MGGIAAGKLASYLLLKIETGYGVIENITNNQEDKDEKNNRNLGGGA